MIWLTPPPPEGHNTNRWATWELAFWSFIAFCAGVLVATGYSLVQP